MEAWPDLLIVSFSSLVEGSSLLGSSFGCCAWSSPRLQFIQGLKNVVRKILLPRSGCITAVSQSTEIYLNGPSNLLGFVLYTITGALDGRLRNRCDMSLNFGPPGWWSARSNAPFCLLFCDGLLSRFDRESSLKVGWGWVHACWMSQLAKYKLHGAKALGSHAWDSNACSHSKVRTQPCLRSYFRMRD